MCNVNEFHIPSINDVMLLGEGVKDIWDDSAVHAQNHKYIKMWRH